MIQQCARRRVGFTLVELIVVIAIVALLIGLLLAGIQKVRSAAARTQCLNHLKQLSLALQQYHDHKQHFPHGMSDFEGKSPQRYMSWHTRLLPFLEQEAIWRQSLADYAREPDFRYHTHMGTHMKVFVCPADSVAQVPWVYPEFTVAYTNYLGVSGTNLDLWDGVLHTDSRVSIRDISDGTSNTVTIGERGVSLKHNFGWWYGGWGQQMTGSADSILGTRELNEYMDLSFCSMGPYHFRAGRSDNPCDVFRFWSHHSGGGHFAFADGSARFLAYSADRILPALGTRAGGETVVLD